MLMIEILHFDLDIFKRSHMASKKDETHTQTNNRKGSLLDLSSSSSDQTSLLPTPSRII